MRMAPSCAIVGIDASDGGHGLTRCKVLLALLCAPLASAAATDGDRIVLDLSALHSDRGTARCALYDSADHFLKQTAAEAVSPIRGGAARCQFSGIVPGRYAIAAYHDENDNRELDSNFLGVPKEGIAASNDARGRFGPRWKEAAFDYRSGELRLRARIAY
jgi:uncharacterized protein (DUF2141 family)